MFIKQASWIWCPVIESDEPCNLNFPSRHFLEHLVSCFQTFIVGDRIRENVVAGQIWSTVIGGGNDESWAELGHPLLPRQFCSGCCRHLLLGLGLLLRHGRVDCKRGTETADTPPRLGGFLALHIAGVPERKAGTSKIPAAGETLSVTTCPPKEGRTALSRDAHAYT
jgi:hypothetical protein